LKQDTEVLRRCRPSADTADHRDGPDDRSLARPPRLSLCGQFGNKMGTALAISAQYGHNITRASQCRIWLEARDFRHRRNPFPISRVWHTSRTQNPVLGWQAHGHDRGKTVEGIARASPILVHSDCRVISAYPEAEQRVSNARPILPQCFVATAIAGQT
jgi:hypothetical protein